MTIRSRLSICEGCSRLPEPKFLAMTVVRRFFLWSRPLSAYQLRTHYILYRILKDTYVQDDLNLYDPETRQKLKTAIPLNNYFEAMDFASGESADSLLMHSMFGAYRDALIELFESFLVPKFVAFAAEELSLRPALSAWSFFFGDLGLGRSI